MKTLIVRQFLVILLVAFTVISSAFAQSEAQIKRELEKRGIDTMEEVQAELRKRGMSEADARRQAKLYGVDYDQYLRDYILKNNKDNRSLKTIDSVPVDTTDYLVELKDNQSQIATEVVAEDLVPSELPYFGYEIFNNNPFANQQALVSNIDPGYIIGPGDELRVYLWGEAEFQFEASVDINGNLFIPNIGQVFVSGASYKDLNDRLKQYLSKFYSGLTKNPQKIFLDVSLTKLRPIRIMVMGESNNPGSHIVNSFATTVNSLYASGGIKTSGSLREIKVFRNNKIVSSIDLYDYLVKGAVSEDLRLISNDVVFIQSRLNTITLKGQVNKPAIYELKNNEGLLDLIGFSGGLKPTAFTQSVTIRRVKSITNRSVNSAFDREIITIDYNDMLSNGINFRLQDGDEVEFATVLDKFDNVVNISGSVFRPGDYQLEPNMTVRDLVLSAGGLRPNTYLEKLDLYRKEQDGTLKFESLPLSDILKEGTRPNYLQPDDSLRIYNLDDLKTLETVSIGGFLSEPKTILWREQLSLYDLIFMSANVEDLEYQNRILTSRADLLRYQPGKTEYQTISFNLDEVLDKEFNLLLKPRDKVILYSRDITDELDKFVTITGAVRNGGRYQLTDSMSVEDLIIQAGGFVRKSFRDSVTVSSENFDFTGNIIATDERVKVNLDYLKGLSSKQPTSYLLMNNDFVNVDLIPGSDEQRRIRLNGEVKYPGKYFLTSKGETLTSLINRAGGLSPNVYPAGAVFYRNDQQLAFSFMDLFEKDNRDFDIILQNGDSIYFPESRFTVKIEGEVYNPSLQKFINGKGVRSYLKNSGGKTKNGRKIFITEPTGYTRKVSWLSNPKILDGSIITVNAKLPKEPREPGKFLENFGTVAAIISSTLTTIFLVDRIGQ